MLYAREASTIIVLLRGVGGSFLVLLSLIPLLTFPLITTLKVRVLLQLQ